MNRKIISQMSTTDLEAHQRLVNFQLERVEGMEYIGLLSDKLKIESELDARESIEDIEAEQTVEESQTTAKTLTQDALQAYARQWLHSNMHDGEDRSQAKGDRHIMSAPELYRLVEEIIADAFDEDEPEVGVLMQQFTAHLTSTGVPDLCLQRELIIWAKNATHADELVQASFPYPEELKSLSVFPTGKQEYTEPSVFVRDTRITLKDM